MLDIISSIKDVIYKLLKSRGYNYKENKCGNVEYIEDCGIERNLEVTFVVKEYIPITFPPSLKSHSERFLLINKLLEDLKKAIEEDMEIYICDNSKSICSICGWHLEDYYECEPCNNPCLDSCLTDICFKSMDKQC